MRKIRFTALCLFYAFMLICCTNIRAQCTDVPGSLYLSNQPLDNTIRKLAQNFTATCDGFLTQLTIQLYYRSEQHQLKSINIGIYKGESTDDPNSSLLYQIENYTPNYTSVVLNIAQKVYLEEGKRYYFIITNSQAELGLPNGLRYNLSLNNSSASGVSYYEYFLGSNKWHYVQQYVPNGRTDIYKCFDIMFTAKVTVATREPHTICKGNVFQILNYDNTYSTYKESNTDVFKLNIKGDTALVTALNYGMASFIYTKKNAPNQHYKCEIAVTTNTPPTITASKQVLTSINDTATITAQGTPNVAMGFDGNTYLTVPYNNGFQSSNGFTFETWLLCNNVNDLEYIFSKGSDVLSQGYYAIYVDMGKIVFQSNGVNNVVNKFYSIIPFKSNRWIHIAVTNDGAVIRFYFNGEKVGEAGYNTPIVDNQQDIIVGHHSNANGNFYKFKGQMDELRFWNRCRTADDIKYNYQKTVLSYSKGLVSYYKFDNVVDNNVALDESINHNNAYINNGGAWVTGSLDIPKYTYLWSNNANKQSIIVTNPETYSYKLTDLTTGCTTQSPDIQITLQSK